MTRRRHVMKLFAVAALAGGCEPASEAAPPATPATAPKPAPAPAPTPTPTSIPTTPALAPVAPAPAPATPVKHTVRTLPNGRPACGNVASKYMPPAKDCVP